MSHQEHSATTLLPTPGLGRDIVTHNFVCDRSDKILSVIESVKTFSVIVWYELENHPEAGRPTDWMAPTAGDQG